MFNKKYMLRIGTPCYMAPEMIHGEQNYDYKIDIYSLSISIAEMINRKSVVSASLLIVSVCHFFIEISSHNGILLVV